MDPEEQTSACLLCASATLWLNPLPGTSSKKVYHRDAEAQRRRTERRGGWGIQANLPNVPHSRVSQRERENYYFELGVGDEVLSDADGLGTLK